MAVKRERPLSVRAGSITQSCAAYYPGDPGKSSRLRRTHLARAGIISDNLRRTSMVIRGESESAPCIQAIATALPPYYVDQPTLTAALSALWQDNPAHVARFERIQRAL